MLREVLALSLRMLSSLRRTESLAARASGSRLAQAIVGDDVVQAKRLGIAFTLSLADNVQRSLYLTGTYEAAFLRFLRRELKPGDTYVDIGAHIGIDAVVAARSVGRTGRVLAFEPSPKTAQRLRTVVRPYQNVTVIEVALGSASCRTDLRFDPAMARGDVSTLSRFTHGELACTVDVKVFDELARSLQQLDVVKLDIEGGEYDAILGMQETLRRLRPRAVVVELHPLRLEQSGHPGSAISRLLEDCGYYATAERFLYNQTFRPVLPSSPL